MSDRVGRKGREQGSASETPVRQEAETSNGMAEYEDRKKQHLHQRARALQDRLKCNGPRTVMRKPQATALFLRCAAFPLLDLNHADTLGQFLKVCYQLRLWEAAFVAAVCVNQAHAAVKAYRALHPSFLQLLFDAVPCITSLVAQCRGGRCHFEILEDFITRRNLLSLGRIQFTSLMNSLAYPERSDFVEKVAHCAGRVYLHEYRQFQRNNWFLCRPSERFKMNFNEGRKVVTFFVQKGFFTNVLLTERLQSDMMDVACDFGDLNTVRLIYKLGLVPLRLFRARVRSPAPVPPPERLVSLAQQLTAVEIDDFLGKVQVWEYMQGVAASPRSLRDLCVGRVSLLLGVRDDRQAAVDSLNLGKPYSEMLSLSDECDEFRLGPQCPRDLQRDPPGLLYSHMDRRAVLDTMRKQLALSP